MKIAVTYENGEVFQHFGHTQEFKVYEVEDGKVVWDFKSIDYPELYDYVITDGSDKADDFSNSETDVPDIVHFNSMRLDDDGNLVCSFRHLSSLICLDRSKDTDQIKWILSGKGDQFGLSEDEKTSCQHYATIDGEYITAFDNGNHTQKSHIRSYRIDPAGKNVETVKTIDIAGRYSSACGNVQHIGDEKYVIGWGRTMNDNICMSVYDFATGKEEMSIALENPRNFTYRCVYYD